MTDITKYNNLDSEIEQAIEEANNTFLNLAKSIRKVYDISISKGYEPLEARKIVETRIINVSPRYLRQLLPPEAKDQSKVRDQDLRHKIPQISESENNKEVNITSKHEIIDTNSTPEEPETPTLEIHKASEDEEDQQIKQFKLESDVDKYRKLAFDKQQQIEELEIKLERLTNQVNTQAEAIRQQQQQTQQIANTGKSLPLPATLHSKLYIEGKGDVQIDMKIFENGNVVCWVDNIEAQKQQAVKKWRNV